MFETIRLPLKKEKVVNREIFFDLFKRFKRY